MCKKTTTVLAINPGTKYLALALFRNTELREWQIKTFKGKWSVDKMRAILAVIKGFVTRYSVDALAMKRLHPSRSSRNLNHLVSRIRSFAKAHSLLVCECSIKELEQCFCPGQRGSKRKMVEAVVLEYPALWNEFEKEKRLKNAYYTRLFEAVALGSVCHENLDKSWPVVNH